MTDPYAVDYATLIAAHHRARKEPMPGYIPTSELRDLPQDTVLISANGARWLTGGAPSGLRALIPVPRIPVEYGKSRTWLYFDRHHDDIDALGPWRLAVEPRQVDTAGLFAEPVGTVALDRNGRAWQLTGTSGRPRLLCSIAFNTVNEADDAARVRADEQQGPFTIIHTPTDKEITA